MRRLSLTLVGLAAVLTLVGAQDSRRQRLLYNPYERPKNGPPLTNVIRKVNLDWLFDKLQDPKHHPSARMPDFEFSDDEVLDLMAYLKSIATMPESRRKWPAWASKTIDEMDDDEMDSMFELADRGRIVWGNARCTICHMVNGPGDSLIGGFVDLRSGGIDLQIAATKLRRDWLFDWIKEPKEYFPYTLMPRYRLAEDEIRVLVEYILRDDAFFPLDEEEDDEEPPQWDVLENPERVGRGKRLIELSRCVLCHRIEGVEDLFELPLPQPPDPAEEVESLVYDLRCLSCHAVDGRGGTYAPDLTGEGSRLQQGWIADFLQSPDMVRPLSQQMPKFNLTAKEAATLASMLSRDHLDARVAAEVDGGPFTSEEIQRGRQAFRQQGCFSCHSDGEGEGGVVGPDLSTVAERLKPAYIYFHLQNPHAVNPYSAEPNLGLSSAEARALTAYLSTKRQ